MSDRPTPEQVGDDMTEDQNARLLIGLFLKTLAHYGYVIVHPDDHPNPINRHDGTTADDLWNDIFGFIAAAEQEVPS